LCHHCRYNHSDRLLPILAELFHHCQYHHHVHRSLLDDVIRGLFLYQLQNALMPRGYYWCSRVPITELDHQHCLQTQCPSSTDIEVKVPKVYTCRPTSLVGDGHRNVPSAFSSCRLVRLRKIFSAGAVKYVFKKSWKKQVQ
jgi:hypothetical protein